MRLEILVDKNGPVVYPLNGSKIFLGSSDKCDIVINAIGISRKHICIITEGDNFSVVDLGSTNGSFINENRLVPGRKTEFTTFFPLRLGSNVLVTLLAEEDYDTKINIPLPSKIGTTDASDKTRVISLKELSKAKTEKLINVRNEKRAEIQGKNPKKASKKKKFNIVPALAFSLLIVAGIFNFSQVKEENTEEYAEVGRIIKSSDEFPKVNSPVNNGNLILENELPSKDYFSKIKFEIKCTSDLEKILCSYLPGINSSALGVTQVGLSFYAMVDGTEFMNQARELLSAEKRGGNTIQINDNLISDTAAYIYLMNAFKKDLDYSNFRDMKLFIALYETGEAELRLFRVIAIKPIVINDLRPNLVEQNLHFIKTNGDSALSVTRNYYRTF